MTESQPTLLKSDIEYCRRIHKAYGKSYYLATQFFPKHIRHATYVLYAFFRLPDEIVDTEAHARMNTEHTAPLQLTQFIESWRKTYATGVGDHPVLRATAAVFKKYNIPYEYSEAFLSAMMQDLSVTRYETYPDLERYMYGSASVVGLMMSYVIGFKGGNETLTYAEKMGYAMQLTNFLRDIGEDYDVRGRVYIPQDEWKRFGVSDETIRRKEISPSFIACMRFQIQRARDLYDEARKGTPFLTYGFPVRVAGALYAQILDEIEKNEYDVFSKRARVPLWKKVYVIMKESVQI